MYYDTNAYANELQTKKSDENEKGRANFGV